LLPYSLQDLIPCISFCHLPSSPPLLLLLSPVSSYLVTLLTSASFSLAAAAAMEQYIKGGGRKRTMEPTAVASYHFPTARPARDERKDPIRKL
jgi:hypothetical protein